MWTAENEVNLIKNADDSILSPGNRHQQKNIRSHKKHNPAVKNVLVVGFEPTSDWTQRILSPPPWTNSGILAEAFGLDRPYEKEEPIGENTIPLPTKHYLLVMRGLFVRCLTLLFNEWAHSIWSIFFLVAFDSLFL